jgi:hypothetical protein
MRQCYDDRITLTKCTQITNMFDTLERCFPTKRKGANSKGMGHTSPQITADPKDLSHNYNLSFTK